MDEIKQYFDNKIFKKKDVVNISSNTTKEDELFDYVEAPDYYKERVRDYDEYDYLIGMDTANIRNMTRIAGGDEKGKIYKLLSFAGSSRDIADPWYTNNFDDTYRDVVEGCDGFLSYLESQGKLLF